MTALALAAALAAGGCGGTAETKDPIPMGQVPSVVVNAAQKRLPGVGFDAAFRLKAGKVNSYVIRGKDKAGKIQEVKISPEGKILGVSDPGHEP